MAGYGAESCTEAFRIVGVSETENWAKSALEGIRAVLKSSIDPEEFCTDEKEGIFALRPCPQELQKVAESGNSAWQ
ncbi:MAG TPA: hypothetical protein VL485_17615 [Ktedonobacteraceae bacterium]|nr:hypothetical protein [Ktedonobacteraceae bacterium]